MVQNNKEKSLKPVFFNNQSRLRNWFQKNYSKKDELIVGYYKKNSGKSSITWDESVDEALCFGWIDGIRRSIDDISYTIRFTPRRKNSIWSTKNINRVEDLIKLKKMKPAGLASFKNRKIENSSIYSYEQKEIKLDDELLEILKNNQRAWEFFDSQVQSYKNPSIRWVMSAKQEQTRHQRLKTLINCSEAGEKIPPLRWGDKKK